MIWIVLAGFGGLVVGFVAACCFACRRVKQAEDLRATCRRFHQDYPE